MLRQSFLENPKELLRDVQTALHDSPKGEVVRSNADQCCNVISAASLSNLLASRFGYLRLEHLCPPESPQILLPSNILNKQHTCIN